MRLNLPLWAKIGQFSKTMARLLPPCSIVTAAFTVKVRVGSAWKTTFNSPVRVFGSASPACAGQRAGDALDDLAGGQFDCHLLAVVGQPEAGGGAFPFPDSGKLAVRRPAWAQGRACRALRGRRRAASPESSRRQNWQNRNQKASPSFCFKSTSFRFGHPPAAVRHQ